MREEGRREADKRRFSSTIFSHCDDVEQDPMAADLLLSLEVWINGRISEALLAFCENSVII